MSDNTRIYFAYGSNMSVRRLKKRVSSAEPLGMGWLPKYKLMFRKRSQDLSGKCDVVPAEACRAFGVLFEIDSSQEERLDQCEGLNGGYLKKACNVQVGEGQCMPAFTYYAHPKHVDDNLRPYTWYLNHVIIGARGGEPSGDVRAGSQVNREHQGRGPRARETRAEALRAG